MPQLIVVVGRVGLLASFFVFAFGAYGNGLPFLARVSMAVVGVLLYEAARRTKRYGQSMLAEAALDRLSRDTRPAVVYLRSFKDDGVTDRVVDGTQAVLFVNTASEEEQIAEIFSELGPVIAIGKPGEKLPQLGAARMYVEDDEWKSRVTEAVSVARLVLYRASDTQGFSWEVELGGKLLAPEQMVFLIPVQSDYESFRGKAEQSLRVRFPDLPDSKRRFGSLAGLIYFDANWQAHFVPPKPIGYGFQLRKPLLSILKAMAKPVFEQLGVRWTPLPIHWTQYVIYGAYFGLTLVLPVVLAIAASLDPNTKGSAIVFLALSGACQLIMLLFLGWIKLAAPK